MTITLEQSRAICVEALKKGRGLTLSPLAVAVLDSAGVAVCTMREDGASLLRPDIAFGKAWGTLGMGFGGHELERRAADRPQFFNALSQMSGGRVIPVSGGVLIRDGNGHLLGAVGVSGDSSSNDDICAMHGVTVVGLVGDNGQLGP